MPGREKVDKVCAHEASTGIMTAQLMTNTPILEVFVHEDESDDPAELAMVFKNRSRDHARNAYLMLYEPEQLVGPGRPGRPPGLRPRRAARALTHPIQSGGAEADASAGGHRAASRSG